jgi:regulator of sigma E protease
MSETKGFLKQLSEKRYRILFWALVAAVFIYLIARNIGAFGNILLVVLGFGMVILVHEFGHFIVAKLSGVKVEAFSIGFPPALFGIQRTENGYRVRLFPKFSEKEGEVEDDRVIFTFGKEGKASDTEYRIGLIPAGGFVKMLGQDDIGPVKNSDDPRSYANKPVGARAAILAAGVTCNVISAMIIFMIVFLIGIQLPPAVIGGIEPGSPAARVGLKPGDEVVEINGKSGNLDFSNIQVAAALSGRDEEVQLKVKRVGELLNFSIVAEETETLGGVMRLFGITQAKSLTIAPVIDADKLLKETGFVPYDCIKSVNERDVRNYWEYSEIVDNAFVPEVTLTAERKDKEGRVMLIESKLKLELVSEGTGHIYSMVPRMRMEQVQVKKSSRSKGAGGDEGGREKGGNLNEDNSKAVLQSGDIILSIGKVLCPTYKEFREVITKHEDKELSIKVLRTDVSGTEKPIEISVTPRRHKDVNEVLIGVTFFPTYDTAHTVVAKTIFVKGGPEELNIPDGAMITSVDGTPVSNFYDVIREIRRYPGERITIDWRDIVNQEVAGSVALNVDPNMRSVSVKSAFTVHIPFDDMKRLYRAGNPIEAVGMGYEKTIMFITQTYLTLRRLVGREVSPKSLLGPVGILAASYTIVAERPFVYYAYFIGLISACIAVVNFLPLPPLDGGLVVLLVVEKIKGSALSERTQGIFAYAGWVLIGAFFLYITFNDVVRTFWGGL